MITALATYSQAATAPLSPELATLRAQAYAEPARFFELANECFFRALHAQSANTQRAYANDWRGFVECCERFGFCPLPAPTAAVEAFIEYSAEWSAEVPYKYVGTEVPRRNLKASSLTRAIAAIGAVHSWLQLPNPATHPDVKHTLKINTRGRAAKQPKAPLLWSTIEQALAILGDDLPALRAKALVTVAFSTMLRRSELVALQVEHFQPSEGSPDGLMWIARSKGDQAGNGDHRYVTANAREHLQRWLSAAAIQSGPIFARLNRNGQVIPKALHPNQVALTFKAVARRAGLAEADVARIAGHSSRIGATHELSRIGASLPELMRAGGWTSPQMPALYLREAEIREGAMARWASATAQRQ